MEISVTGNNEIKLLTFMFTIKMEKKIKKHRYYCYKTNQQTNKVKWNINKRS